MSKEMNFEEAVRELEKTVKAMESGDLGLDDLLAEFEKGIGLLRLCEKKLGEAEGRIAVLSKEETAVVEGTGDGDEAKEDIFAGEAMIPEDELPF